jgi:ABC-2 type transport system ATP-binding protein
VYFARTLFEMTRTPFENAIETQGLTKSYGEVRALDGIDLTVAAGTVFGLLGPNGAGKSTTVKILTTLSQPDAGSARVAGHDVLAEPDRVRHAIGVVGQKHGTDREATGRENLVLQGEFYGISGRELKRRAAESLERFGLADAADRQAKTYSGGMLRRLDVAMGLIHRPQVLFLDEPTTGLDPEARAQMWGEIERLAHQEGMTILLTTHYLEEADRLSSQLAIVDRGRIVARGTPDALKSELQGDTVQIELTDSDGPAARAALDHVTEVDDVLLDGRTLRARAQDGGAAIPAVLAALEAHGVRAAAVTLARPSLDDVYLRHAGRAFQRADTDGQAVAR